MNSFNVFTFTFHVKLQNSAWWVQTLSSASMDKWVLKKKSVRQGHASAKPMYTHLESLVALSHAPKEALMCFNSRSDHLYFSHDPPRRTYLQCFFSWCGCHILPIGSGLFWSSWIKQVMISRWIFPSHAHYFVRSLLLTPHISTGFHSVAKNPVQTCISHPPFILH